MDRTILYREIVRLALEGSPQVSKPQPHPVPDSVTKESVEISQAIANTEVAIKQLRPQYLAMSGPERMSEEEKNTFDHTVRRMLQNEQQRIRRLERLEATRQEEEKSNQRWWASNPKADGVSKTLGEHRRGMFYNLNARLQAVSLALGEMQQVQHARNTSSHASRSQAIKTPLDSQSAESLAVNTGRIKEPTNTSPPDALIESMEQQQQQQLAEEHDVLLEELNATLDKAQQAEQSLREIADLQSELNQHLSAQNLQLDSMSTDALRTTKDISKANEQLEQAKKSSRRSARIVIVSSLSIGVLLLMMNGR